MREKTYTIRDLSQEFGITSRAIRFYESRGLIAPRRVDSKRIYSRRDRARLILILRGKNLGFTLEDIGEYLALYDADPEQKMQTKMLLSRIEEISRELQKKRDDLDHTLIELETMKQRCIAHLETID